MSQTPTTTDALAEALRPFAKIASLTERMRPNTGIWAHHSTKEDESFCVTVEDCRKARAALAQHDAAKEKIAPVQGYSGIPWSMHLRAYDAYCKKWSPQPALIEGGCRGGFSTDELDGFIPGWREELSELHRLRAENAELRTAKKEPASGAQSEDSARLYEVRRIEDMSSIGELQIYQQEDGDVVVSLYGRDSLGEPVVASVEFCSPGFGGGRSPKTLGALRRLAEAMAADNIERPIKAPAARAAQGEKGTT